VTTTDDDSKTTVEQNEQVADGLRKSKDMLSKAKALVDEGKFEEGLVLFTSALDGNVGYASRFNLRIALSELLNKNPAAREPLSLKRNQMETMLKEGPLNRRAFEEEWMELNFALGDDYQEIELLKFLHENNQKSKHQVTILNLIKINFGKYLRDKRYKILEPHFDYLGRMFIGYQSFIEAQKLFPTIDRFSDHDDHSYRTITEEEGTLLFELGLALGKIEQAKLVARKIIDGLGSRAIFLKLLAIARRINQNDAYSFILSEAKSNLSIADFNILQSELSAIN